MENTSRSAFSHDGQYLAVCGTDGKLKIWETATNRLKQEFVPNLHLSSPCSVLGWIVVGTHTSNATSPWKKPRKKSINEDEEQKEIVAMGSTNGNITLYDVSTSSINDQLENGHSSTITALTWSPHAGLFTAGEDKEIVEWNLQEKSVKCKWKSGKGKVTALAVLPEGKSILSAAKMIKWWDLKTKEVIANFAGHANQVNSLSCVKITNEISYLFSSGNGDDYLSVYSLNEAEKDKIPKATFALSDEAVSVSVKSMKDSQICILAVTRSGQAEIFKYEVDGYSTKPYKPILNVLIAADVNQKESVQQIPILQAQLVEDSKMLLVYGSTSALTIEKVAPDFSEKVQCLVRTDVRKQKEKKEEAITKTKSAEIEDNAVYIAPGFSEDASPSIASKRTKSGTGSQLPLKTRLENLSMNEESAPKKSAPKGGESLAQLLIQGLHSGDKTMLSTVLLNKDEKVMKKTVSQLPVQAIVPLLKELKNMMGKAYTGNIAVAWMKTLLVTHAASIIAQPAATEILASLLSFIDAKQQTAVPLMRLQGKVELLSGQIHDREGNQEKDIAEECLLDYEDQDSSEEDIEVGNNGVDDSESDDNWEETSDQEKMQEDIENGKSDDDGSISSSDS